MAILIGIAIYLVAVICLCALVGASRAKQERCLREMKKATERDPGERAVASDELVHIGLHEARRA